jgi:hypothetical protein
MFATVLILVLTVAIMASAQEQPQRLDQLPLGSLVVDQSWHWQFRPGDNYTGRGPSKPVSWLVVGKNHFPGMSPHVTIVTADLIASYAFDDSTNRGDPIEPNILNPLPKGNNHWGESGTGNARHGIRPFLNITFFSAFSEQFAASVLTTDLQNKIWHSGQDYVTKDNVFVLSMVEMGGSKFHQIKPNSHVLVGRILPWFDVADISEHRRRVGGVKIGGEGDSKSFWTRTPSSRDVDWVFTSYEGFATHPEIPAGVRPALNLRGDMPVYGPYGSGDQQYYTLFFPAGAAPVVAGGSSPGQQAGAVAATGTMMAIAAWLMNRSQEIQTWEPFEGEVREGKVWYRQPWDDAHHWIDKAEYDHTRERLGEGKVWSRYGWQEPSQAREYEADWEVSKYHRQQESQDLMEDVRRQRLLERTGKVSPMEMAELRLWLMKRDITPQAYNDMERLLDDMIIETEGGERYGDINQVRQALAHELRRVNQPELDYWERYVMREDAMNARFETVREVGSDIIGGADAIKDLYGEGDILVDAFHKFREFGMTDARKHLLDTNPNLKVTPLEALLRVEQAARYYEGYRSVDMSPTEAIGRSLTQTGVQWFATKNPVIGLVDTGLKYSTKQVFGQEYSPSKGLEIIVNRSFDLFSEAPTGPGALDFSSPDVIGNIRSSQLTAIEDALATGKLPAGERDQLLQVRTKLLQGGGTGGEW